MTKIVFGGTFKMCAVLQRRGEYNFEKMSWETFPGCLQVTCHGGAEEGESFEAALQREIGEELGENFANSYLLYMHEGVLQTLSETADEKKHVLTFGAFVPSDMIADRIRLEPGSGGLELIAEDQMDQIVEIKPGFKLRGPELYRTLAMFPDEIAAVKRAFEIFGKM